MDGLMLRFAANRASSKDHDGFGLGQFKTKNVIDIMI